MVQYSRTGWATRLGVMRQYHRIDYRQDEFAKDTTHIHGLGRSFVNIRLAKYKITHCHHPHFFALVS